MRMRVISVAVVLGLGIVGIALAQQAGQQPKEQTKERMRLRDQVVKLRVEIELLELDHDAAKAEFLEIKKDIRELESEGAQKQLGEMALAQMMLTGGDQALGTLAKKGAKGEKEIQDLVESTLKEQIVKAKAERDSKRKDYASQAAILAEKRLELAEVEKRYNEILFHRS
jgi:hypothetical protein